ncbi:MAG: Glyoxalase-like domain [Thermoleophilaceae bacterium]|nr:Glyoxalase-like domain [Thermoleophilaceae bacterium]
MPARRLAVFCEPARAERANIAATTQTAGAERAIITATTDSARAERANITATTGTAGLSEPKRQRWGQGVAYVRDPFGTLVEPASPTD